MPKVKPEKTKSVRAGRAHSANYNPVAASVKRLYNKSAPLLICGTAMFLMLTMWPIVLRSLPAVLGVS